jgi:hypothetical protein
MDVADGLIGHPVVSPTWAQREYNVSYPTANAAIAKLCDLGILREVTGRTYGRMFGALEVIDIINR